MPGLLALALFAAPAHAQRSGFGMAGRGGAPPSHGGAARGRGHHGRRGFYGSGFGDSYPFYDPYDDTDGRGEPRPAPYAPIGLPIPGGAPRIAYRPEPASRRFGFGSSAS